MPRVIHTGDPVEALRLEDESARASVTLAPPRGGIATRFTVGDVPVLFLDETTLRDPSKNVRGGIPVLFPLAGKLADERYRVGERQYAMPQHGFARNAPWAIAGESVTDGASVTLTLEASAATRALYPFEFALRFTYRLRGAALRVEQRFENRGDAPMPATPGLHPYFYVPDATKAVARVDTDATRAHDNVSGHDVAIERPVVLAGREVDLVLLDHTPRHAVLHRPGLPGVRLSFGADEKLLVLWTLPGRDFVCVEPWRDGLGAFARPSPPSVPPGGFLETTLTIELAE
jgi:galactose mutarotase-like enzyme